MNKLNPLDPALPLWLADDGNPVACTEKIRVLNDNLRELEAMMRDALEDAVLMGCSEQMMREALKALADAIDLRF